MLKRFTGFLVSGLMVISGFGYCQTTGVMGEGIRADGMGGAYTAVAEGYECIFYNPAGLTKLTGGDLVLPGVYLKANQDMITWAINLNNINIQNPGPADFQKLSGLANLNGAARGILIAGVIKPSWALNIYGIDNLLLSTDMPDSTTFHQLVKNTADLGLIFSLAGRFPKILPFLDFSYGGNIKYIYRTGFQYDMTNGSESQIFTQPRHGWGLDAGIICKVPGLVDVGIMFRDIYSKIGAETVPMNLTVGVSTKLLGFITLSADISDLTATGGDFLDKLKIGAEVNLFGFLKLRGGLSQKFPALGAGVNLFFLNLDYAFMGEKPFNPSMSAQNPIGTHALNCSLIF